MNCQASASDMLLSQSGLAAHQMNSLNSINISGGNKVEETTKSQFKTREGTYRRLSHAEYSQLLRPVYGGTATSANGGGSSQCSAPLRCSFCTIQNVSELICFNVARDLYVYPFRGVQRFPELNKPIDKRSYKTAFPTAHDFNQHTANKDTCCLLIGLNTGQIQLIDLKKKDYCKPFNDEKLIDKSKVTCIRWVPNSSELFLVSHASGQLYQYNRDLCCDSKLPSYQLFKSGDGYSVYTCKAKSSLNPMYRWVIGDGALHEFAFSPCGKYFATVSQDGFMRVFDYFTMELVGRVRSYFGGLLCVCWSPDGRFVATGGEDDLVTVWSFPERRVVAKGRGHKSWVSVVSFDPYNCGQDETKASRTENHQQEESNHHHRPHQDSGDEGPLSEATEATESSCTSQSEIDGEMVRSGTFNETVSTTNFCSYRFGSVGQDTNLCLWDLSDEILRQPFGRSRTSIIPATAAAAGFQQTTAMCNGHVPSLASNQLTIINSNGNVSQSNGGNLTSSTTVSNGKTLPKKEHRRNFSLVSRTLDKNTLSKQNQMKTNEDPVKLLGTAICPRLNEIPMLEPLVCKKIAHERLTSIVFRPDCFMTGCQEGIVSTWARPGKWSNHPNSSPSVSINEDLTEPMMDENGSTVV